MYATISDIEKLGWMPDQPQNRLPPNGWSVAENVKFTPKGIEKRSRTSYINIPADHQRDFWGLKIQGLDYWAYFGADNTTFHLYREGFVQTFYLGDLASNIPVGYKEAWQLTMFNGVPIFSIKEHSLFYISTIGQPTYLPNFPAQAKLNIIRPYGNILIGLGLKRNGIYDGRRIKWSHPADPGTLPISWDHTDPAKDAGERTLSEGIDELVDCLTLGAYNVLYLAESIWLMRFVGGTFIFDTKRIIQHVGLIYPGALTLTDKSQHVVFGEEDVYLFTGEQVNSICNEMVKKEIFTNLDRTMKYQCRVETHHRDKEIWITFPQDGTLRTFIWNWLYNTWNEKTDYTGNKFYYSNTQAFPGEETFGSTVRTFADTNPTPDPLIVPIQERMFHNGVEPIDLYNVKLEKHLFPLKGSIKGELVLEHNLDGLYTRFRPNFSKGSQPLSVLIDFGVRDTIEDEINYTVSRPFIVGVDREIDGINLTGKYLDFRITDQSQGDLFWSLLSYEIDVVSLGGR